MRATAVHTLLPEDEAFWRRVIVIPFVPVELQNVQQKNKDPGPPNG